MPPERSVFYSADLIKRQYSIPENELKSNYDYTSIMPVYSIIFMEESQPANWNVGSPSLASAPPLK